MSSRGGSRVVCTCCRSIGSCEVPGRIRILEELGKNAPRSVLRSVEERVLQFP
jgi:hypothetical protein